MITLSIPGFKQELRIEHLMLDFNGTLSQFENVIGIGNGRNDMLMIKAAAIGIVVIQKEGAASETLAVADNVCTSVIDALEAINNPKRLKATLRG